jgi:protein subunit release factor A
VTDHRVGLTINNIQAVMEGNLLDQFISELRKSYEQEQLDSLLNTTS